MKHFFQLLLILQCLILWHPLSGNGVVIINGTQGIYLKMLSSDVRVQVQNQIAVVTSTQVFINTTGEKTPMRYAFPLHPNANAIDLRWYIKGKWHYAIISKSTQTDTIPGEPGEQIQQNLLTYMGNTPLLFTPMDSIDADSSVTFVLKYVELLPYSFGVVKFAYPNDYSLIQADQFVDHQHFSFELKSERTIESAEIATLDATVQLTPHEATITSDLYEQPALIDYEVLYQLSSTELGVYSLSTFLPDSLLYCDELGNGYVSLIIEPESNASTEVIEKNFSLIIDRSGSMAGVKVEEAKRAAKFIVEHLNFGDQFNIIDFSTTVKSLFNEMTPYTLSHKNEALAYIDQISASGSTNISGALTTSIQQFLTVDTNKANIIIFFTDGMATAGITGTSDILQQVQETVQTSETEIFLFTFGIGNDVDKKLLTLLAVENGGLADFLENEELEEKITGFFLTINNPVLLHTQFSFSPDIVTAVYPDPLPNLYKGQQLILSGRYAEPADVTLTLSGKAFNLSVAYAFQIHLADTNDIEKSFLPKIWAKQAIDKYAIEFNLAESESEADSIQAIIDSLSICYGVISTQFTSFEDGGDVTAVEFEESLASESFKVTAVPNPFQKEISFHIASASEMTGNASILVLDNTGKKVAFLEKAVSGTSIVLNCNELESLAPGVYYCIITINSNTVIRMILKV